jgi:N-carbamoyl-L-amino-acid hydrolase
MQIRPERLISNLRELASIGKFETGVNRPAFSEADIAARRWLCRKMTEAGLAAAVDGYGNVVGRMQGVDKAVLVGSHSDTVPNGGWLDGSLGVIYGLEIARCIAESGAAGIGVDAVSFQDEEGTFLALLGSRSFCGEDVASDIANAKDKSGRPLRDEIDQSGLAGVAPARLDPVRHLAFFEAHIEQGPRLENDGRRIGVVTAIVGIKTFRLRFLGQADHAGTTPMAMRRDAGAAALRFGAAISDKLKAKAGLDTVWNVGSVAFKPGASNVVPSEAELVFQARDTSASAMDELERLVRQTAQECAALFNAEVEINRTLDTKPTKMSPLLTGLIQQASSDLGAAPMQMPSGAGHDAMVMARHIPAAMLFVPSIGGRSHDIVEDTSEDDIILGAQVLLRAVELFAVGQRAR